MNPRVRNWAKIRNNVADLSPIRIDSPIDMVDVELISDEIGEMD